MVSLWQSERLHDLNCCTITWKCSQEWTWQAWLWAHKFVTSGIADHDATTNPPPTGGGSEAGAQESPSTSDIKWEYDIIPPDKGKGNAVPDNTAQGGSGHDPPRDWERMSHLLRWNKSDDHLWWHSKCVAIQQQDQITKISWTDCCPGWMKLWETWMRQWLKLREKWRRFMLTCKTL